ncbi:hypothetical protein [Mesorhizobium sp.]|uniref:hypothetical protein n=1 Tax=Mesorhizobium sp. TaxID=1871066 RepID=UPI000FE943FA|nr:hypothetical protein [Mesorhizobium sp.]RWQ59581.1 MAG: hypothetical protein EOS83_10995 [Mesorhizobium sp.]
MIVVLPVWPVVLAIIRALNQIKSAIEPLTNNVTNAFCGADCDRGAGPAVLMFVTRPAHPDSEP